MPLPRTDAAPASPEPTPSAAGARPHVLVVDDDPHLLDLIRRIVSSAGYEPHTVARGGAALEAVASGAFEVVLIDIYLPDMSGFELLTQLRLAAPATPIVMISGFADPGTAQQAIRAGATDFLAKPFKVAELLAVVERNTPRPAPGSGAGGESPRILPAPFLREAVLDAILSALDVRDTESEGHSERVTAYTLLLADRLGVGRQELYDLERGALLHDIGRIAVPDRILEKPGPLSDEEWKEIHKHPTVGYKMCSSVAFLRGAAHIILHHHERWDGAGYPDGLRGEMIPLGSRIFAVADALEALTTDRPWRRAVPFDYARREIERHAGTQFDPSVVDAFLRIERARWESMRG